VTELVLASAVVVTMVGLALWRPGIAVMALGIYLFVQSALVRLPSVPEQVATVLARADEIVLAALLVRTTAYWLITRDRPLPKPLWALVAFAAIGIVSGFVNGVSPLSIGLGIFLAVKAGLWLYVGAFLTVDLRVAARYGYLVGTLFVGVVVVAVLQVVGVPLPWAPFTRAGEIAATSIWNFHSAFGGAMSVAVGLSVVASRLPGEGVSAAVLAVAGVAGVILSTARRLLASVVVGAVAVLVALPAEARARMRSQLSILRRPAVLLVLVAGLVLGAVVVGPRLVNLAELTWQRYVVDLPQRDRYQLYEGAFQLVQDSPLVGRGPATFGSYASVVVGSPAYAEVGYERPRQSMVVGGQVASVVAEYGILGFAAFVAFIVLVFSALVPIARGSWGTVRAALATGGIFMVANMVVESAVNPVFSNSFVTFFTFVGIGVAMTLDASTRHDEDGDSWNPADLSRRWRAGSLAATALLLALLGVIAALAAGR
jgi:O-antigen ligase